MHIHLLHGFDWLCRVSPFVFTACDPSLLCHHFTELHTQMVCVLDTVVTKTHRARGRNRILFTITRLGFPGVELGSDGGQIGVKQV